MDQPRDFSDLPEPLREAIFLAAWRHTPGWRGRDDSNHLRLVCRQARATIDGAIRKISVRVDDGDLAAMDACIQAVGAGWFPALRAWTFSASKPHWPAGTIAAITQAIPPSLHVLELRGGRLGRSEAEALAAAAAMPALRQLLLRESGASVAELGLLAQGFGPRLELLDLSHNQLGTGGAAALADMAAARLPALRRLDLSSNGLGEAGVRALMSVAWDALECLYLEHTYITQFGAVALANAGAARLPALRELYLSGCCLCSAGVEALTQVSWAALEILDLSNNIIMQGGAAALGEAGAARLPALHELNLSANSLGVGGVLALMQRPWPALEVLDLSRSGINYMYMNEDDHAEGNQAPYYGPLLDGALLPALRRLLLSGNILGDAGVRALLWRPWPRLQELDLKNTFLGVTGAAALGVASVHCFPALETLSLGLSYPVEVGVLVLVQATPWLRLRRLDLTNTALFEEGMAALAASSHLQLPALQELHLNSLGVSNSSIVALSRGSWCHLEVLTFSKCSTERTVELCEAVSALAAAGAARFPALRCLNLQELPVSKWQEAALRAAWPRANIIVRRRPDTATKDARRRPPLIWEFGGQCYLVFLYLLMLMFWGCMLDLVFMQRLAFTKVSWPLLLLPPLLWPSVLVVVVMRLDHLANMEADSD